MALFNYAKRELNAKIVFYGPGLCGKTTNIQYIHNKLNPAARGKLLSLATQTDRTLFFDFLPVELGEIRGFKTRFHLYTVPGQVFYNATRKMVLKGVDGIVFVADSQASMVDANLESLKNLEENLAEYGLSLDTVPYAIQFNKRDLPEIVPMEEMDRLLNPRRVPTFGASSLQGKGVLPTLTTICKMVLKRLRIEHGGDDSATRTIKEKAAAYRSMRQGAKPASVAAAQGTAESSPKGGGESTEAAARSASVAPAPEQTTETSGARQPDLPTLKVDVAGLPKSVSDTELEFPVDLYLGRSSCRVNLRIRLSFDGETPGAEIFVEEKR